MKICTGSGIFLPLRLPLHLPLHCSLLFSLLCLLLSSCAVVKPYERERLSDPVMDPKGSLGKQSLEQKFFSTREGSMGGGGGIGGGCGCAK